MSDVTALMTYTTELALELIYSMYVFCLGWSYL